MTWKNYLRPSEKEQLERLEKLRDLSREAYNAARIKIKSRAESRMKAEKGPR